MHPLSASRLANIEPFHVMELLTHAKALEAAGRDIIHMEIGEPDFPTPAPIIAAAQTRLARGDIFYTPALGLPELREAIAEHYRTRYGVSIAPSRIAVTAGASGALLLALACMVSPGSEWLLTDPGYPCNANFVRAFEGLPVGIQVRPEDRFQPTPEDIERHWNERTGGALFASPANPTGTLIDETVLGDIARCVAKKGGTLIVDEIYQGLTYEQDARSALSISDDIFIVQSFSKYFNMTGWRLGWLVVPERYTRDIEKLAQNLFIAASTIAQYGALAAFLPETIDILEQRRAEFKRRRDYLVPALESLGFHLPAKPEGAFYAYTDCSTLTPDSHQFALSLLERAGVAVTPGLDFGVAAPRSHIRFAYTTGIERLEEAIDRIRTFLAK
ncbi:pyridoxal phosphate-dependent aminotransferase [Propionivibrio dicarboxylicus]|uniref:Aminotransferase n=1 Tax=Propionivibrio dicarboxylicus TaxID=83767 RepID=A0A1G8FKD0_9RHOO|nr:pyridoxal phosphate-dependent aminotransferase [Propionivibrio dicarboxylicus]SDH82555.1 Aspartate/methionine/tyrosine aminotransferase [Propionivibrio dicarboxylicus]